MSFHNEQGYEWFGETSPLKSKTREQSIWLDNWQHVMFGQISVRVITSISYLSSGLGRIVLGRVHRYRFRVGDINQCLRGHS